MSKTRLWLAAGAMGIALAGPPGADAAPGRGRARHAPVKFHELAGAVPLCKGDFVTRDGRITGRIFGHGTAGGVRYVFVARVTGRVDPETGEVRKGRIKGRAKYVTERRGRRRPPRRVGKSAAEAPERPADETIASQPIRGEIAGTFAAFAGAEIEWRIEGPGVEDRPIDWQGRAVVDTDLPAGAPSGDLAINLLHVDGDARNSTLLTTVPVSSAHDWELTPAGEGASLGDAQFSDALRVLDGSISENVDGAQHRTTFEAVQSAGNATLSEFTGIYETRWRDDDGVRHVDVGLVTAGSPDAAIAFADDVLAILPDGNTHVETTAGGLSVTATEGDAPEVRPGDIVVTEQGGGATERVVAIVEEELGRVSVLTEPAPLAAAVESGSVSAVTPGGGSVVLDGTCLLDEPGARVDVVEGTVTFRPQSTVATNVDAGELGTTSIIFRGDLACDLAFTAQAGAGASSSVEVALGEPIVAPSVVVHDAVVPFVAEVTVTMVARVDVEAAGALDIAQAASVAGPISVTVNYADPDGDGPLRAAWTATARTEADVSVEDPVLGADSDGAVRVEIVPVVQVSVNRQCVATLEAEVYVQVDATPAAAADVPWTVTAGETADVVVHVDTLIDAVANDVPAEQVFQDVVREETVHTPEPPADPDDPPADPDDPPPPPPPPPPPARPSRVLIVYGSDTPQEQWFTAQGYDVLRLATYPTAAQLAEARLVYVAAYQVPNGQQSGDLRTWVYSGGRVVLEAGVLLYFPNSLSCDAMSGGGSYTNSSGPAALSSAGPVSTSIPAGASLGSDPGAAAAHTLTGSAAALLGRWTSSGRAQSSYFAYGSGEHAFVSQGPTYSLQSANWDQYWKDLMAYLMR